MKRLIKDIMLFIYWYPVRIAVQSMSFGAAYAFGKLLGRIVPYLAAKRRRSFEDILQDIFHIAPPQQSYSKLLRGAFRVLLLNEIDTFLYPRMNAGNIDRLVSYQGLGHLDAALTKGKGAMLLFGHFGSNQMVMPAIGHKGYRMCQISAPATVWEKVLAHKNLSRVKRLSLKIRWELEATLPVKHINMFGSLKEAFLCLKRNEVLGIAIDGGGGKNRMETDFMGRRALFATGALDIALRTGCAVLPTFMVRDSNGRHTLIIEPQLKMEPDTTAESALAVAVQVLERYVRSHPDHYVDFLALRKTMAKEGDVPLILESDEI